MLAGLQRDIRFPRGAAYKIAVSALIVALLFTYFDFQTVMTRFARLDLAFFSLVLGLLCLQVMVAALRWHFILRGMGAPISIREAVDNFVAGGLGNILFLTSIGGMSVRGFLLARRGLKLEVIAAGLTAERLVVALGLGLVFLPAALLAGEDYLQPTGFLSGSDSALVLIGLLALVLAGLLLSLFLTRIELRWLRSFRIHLQEVLRRPSRAGLLLALSCTIHLAGFATVGILAAGLGVEVPLAKMFAVMPLVAVLSSVPVSLGGWGVREGSMVLGFSMLGVGAEDTLAVSILYGLSGILVALALAAIFLIHKPARGQMAA